MNEKQLILAVDDEPSNLKLISGILGEKYQLALAKSAAVAAQFLERKTPDLILLDIKMPEKDGIEFAEELMEGEGTFSIPFVFISGLDDEDTHRKARTLGALGFIEKPIQSDKLLALVDEIFRERF